MKIARLGLTAFVVLGGAGAASAQSTATAGPFPVTGSVPALCAAGTLTQDDGVFAVGVLIDTATGFLRTNLAAPAKTLRGSFCTARSTIRVSATPMTAQAFNGTPPTGFSRSVNFTANAAGWTTNAATFDTAAATNPNALQSRTTAFTGDIIVSIGGFGTGGGGTLRLVEDANYQGSVTVTLAAAS